MRAILRFPAMTQQYQNALRRQEDRKQHKRNETESLKHLRYQNIDVNESKFFDQFVDKLDMKNVLDEEKVE